MMHSQLDRNMPIGGIVLHCFINSHASYNIHTFWYSFDCVAVGLEHRSLLHLSRITTRWGTKERGRNRRESRMWKGKSWKWWRRSEGWRGLGRKLGRSINAEVSKGKEDRWPQHDGLHSSIWHYDWTLNVEIEINKSLQYCQRKDASHLPNNFGSPQIFHTLYKGRKMELFPKYKPIPDICFIYTVSQKNKTPHSSHNFTNYYQIFKIFSLADSVVNLQQIRV